MKVLILSCSTGGGHNTAGKAICEALRAKGHEALIEDAMTFGGERLTRFVNGTYIGMARHFPRLFGMVYKLGDLVSSNRRKSPLYYANRLLAKKLYKYISENGFDAVVVSHLFPAEILTAVRKRLPDAKLPYTLAITTDYTCSPFWEETDCDCYVIAHEALTAEYEKAGLDAEKIRTFGIPVSSAFSAPYDVSDLRRTAGIPEDAHVYLIAGGSMGYDLISRFALEFAEGLNENEYAVIVCGNNRKMHSYLRRHLSRYTNVKVIGFTEHMAKYLSLADVFYSKPGGASSTEAAVRNIPLVFLDDIPGCETHNREFFISHGMATRALNVREALTEGRRLCESKSWGRAMKLNQRKCINKNAASDIVSFLEEQVAAANSDNGTEA